MRTGWAVLVVDDEPMIREWAGVELAAGGCTPYFAADGSEAFKVMESHAVDLALVDMLMPGKDGVETIVEIKKRWPGCKILAMSGGGKLGTDQYLRLASMIGADDTVMKPFSLTHMMLLVDRMLLTRSSDPPPERKLIIH